jgi:argininosuccinate synthase
MGVEPQRIALAYSGSVSSSAAVRWLMERHGADVVAVIVDVGQTDDLEEVYTRALACGAIRAHVIDRRELFARDTVLAAVAAPAPLDDDALRRLPDPLIASTLVDIAAIEGVGTVAHAAPHASFDEHLQRLDPALRIIAARREWAQQGLDVTEYVRTHDLPHNLARVERHLLIRPLAAMAPSEGAGADVTIGFAEAIPVSVNGVAMELEELIESLSLIGGQYRLSASTDLPAPAAALLHAAYRASQGRVSATLHLKAGSLDVVEERKPTLVPQR